MLQHACHCRRAFCPHTTGKPTFPTSLLSRAAEWPAQGSARFLQPPGQQPGRASHPPHHPPQHAGLAFFSVEALSSDTTILTPSPGLLGLSSLASDFLDTCACAGLGAVRL